MGTITQAILRTMTPTKNTMITKLKRKKLPKLK